MTKEMGFIKLWRRWFDEPVFADPNLWKLWIACNMLANFKKKHVKVPGLLKPVDVNPGQFITGRYSLFKIMYPRKRKNNPSPYTVWRWLQTLAEMNYLQIKTCNKYSLITIANWHIDQGSNNGNAPQMSSTCTTDAPQVSTTKNVKNDKNENNKHKLQLNMETWKFENVSDDQLRIWKDAYPAVDLQAEMKKAAAWVQADPQKRRKVNWKAFLNNWFIKKQERPVQIGNVGKGAPPKKKTAFEKMVERQKEWIAEGES